VQGLGRRPVRALLYDERGQMLNATWPTTWCRWQPRCLTSRSATCLATADSKLGAKGAGEAGTAGAPGAVMTRSTMALRPLGAQPIATMPLTPE